jgi:hypothetical protein
VSDHNIAPRSAGCRGIPGIPLAVSLNHVFLNPSLISISGGNLAAIPSKYVAKTLYVSAVSPEGAQAVVEANVLEYVVELLSSSNQEVQRWTSSMLRELGRHRTTAREAVGYLVSLLR